MKIPAFAACLIAIPAAAEYSIRTDSWRTCDSDSDCYDENFVCINQMYRVYAGEYAGSQASRRGCNYANKCAGTGTWNVDDWFTTH